MTTFETIHDIYIKKTKNYRQELQNLLSKLPKLKRDSTLSVNEFLELIKNHHNQNVNYIQTSTSNSHSSTATFSGSTIKFYKEISSMEKYIQIHYP